MRELLVRGKNTIDPEVIDPGGRSVEISPVKIDFTFTFIYMRLGVCISILFSICICNRDETLEGSLYINWLT
jgi:hypothetical protein